MSSFERSFLYDSLLLLFVEAGGRRRTAATLVCGALFATSWADLPTRPLGGSRRRGNGAVARRRDGANTTRAAGGELSAAPEASDAPRLNSCSISADAADGSLQFGPNGVFLSKSFFCLLRRSSRASGAHGRGRSAQRLRRRYRHGLNQSPSSSSSLLAVKLPGHRAERPIVLRSSLTNRGLRWPGSNGGRSQPQPDGEAPLPHG